MGKFQIAIIVIFVLFAAGGVFFFASYRDSGDISNIEIVVWGDEEISVFNEFIAEFDKNTERAFKISYEEISGENFADKVIEAIASGREPDIIILSAEEIRRFQDKIFVVPFQTISERDFRDAFIEGGEIFLTDGGVLGLPFSVDPLVMYWNRDILQSNGISSPPKYWSEFFPLAEKLTEKDEALNITKSAVALGEYQNIKNAKEIIISLINQSGNPIVTRSGDTVRVVLSNNLGEKTSSSESALNFYTEFSNPSKTSYSWNRALKNSQDFFIAGDLAIYFGFASEFDEIKAKNPNLNFDVAPFPQLSGDAIKSAYGKMKALAVLKRSKNPGVAVTVASAMIREDNIRSMSVITELPPVRRALLGQKPGIASLDLFYDSALISQGFFDPDSEATDNIFKGLVERIVSGRDGVNDSLSRASVELNALFVDN